MRLTNLKQLDELSFYLHNNFTNIEVLKQLPKLETLFVAFDYLRIYSRQLCSVVGNIPVVCTAYKRLL